jgi:16S rRNA (cytidine1402-2'-O)-methyltransferase
MDFPGKRGILLNEPGTLYLIPTPLGNNRDITLRAIDVLKNTTIIAAEDTRSAATLLRALEIESRTISYHDHNEESRSPGLVEKLKQGQDVALISEAGTPLLADPGYRLVQMALEENIPVIALPGPSAITTALSASGLAVNEFAFLGFPPRKQAQRMAAFQKAAAYPFTQVYFEAPHRLLTTLSDMREAMSDRQACVAWNLSKDREHYFRGMISELEAEFSTWDKVRGEITLLVAGNSGGADDATWTRAEEAIRFLLDQEMTPRQVRDAVELACDLPKREVYQRVLAIEKERHE